MLASLAHPDDWKARLAVCLALSLALHLALIRTTVEPPPEREPLDGALLARLLEPRAPAVAEPAVAIGEPSLPPTPRLTRRDPALASTVKTDTEAPVQRAAAANKPAPVTEESEEARFAPSRSYSGILIVDEPARLPGIQAEGVDLNDYIRREAAHRPIDWLEEPKIPPPQLLPNGRKRGAVELLLLVGESGEVEHAFVVDDSDADAALVNAAMEGMRATRFEHPLRDGLPVKVRIFVQVNFGYE